MGLEHVDADAAGPGQPVALSRVAGVARTLVRAALFAVVAAWIAGLAATFRVLVFGEQFILAMVGLATALVFLEDAGWRWRALRYVDLGVAFLAVCVFAYVAWIIPRLMELPIRPPEILWLSALMVAMVLEATRRKTGPVLPVLVLLLVAVFMFIGPNLPEAFQSRAISLPRLVPYLALDTNAMMGRVMVIVGTIVLPFIIFGSLLNTFGGNTFFTGAANALVGRFRGGPAKVSVVGSAAFGMVSGSAVANVVAVGSVSIPLMARTGYRTHVAAAIEAVSSTGGQLMPPIMGASAFLMAEFLEIPYQQIVIAAILPSLFYYLSLFVSVDFEARRLALGPRKPPHEFNAGWGRGWVFVVPVAVLIYLLFVEGRTAGNAAVWTVIALIAVHLLGPPTALWQRLRKLGSGILSAMGASAEIVLLGATATFVIGVLHTTGFASAVTIQIVIISAGQLAVLLALAALLSILLGMGMPTVGVYILLALLAAPALAQIGVEPLAAHMYVLYFGMLSLITPPVAIASFAAASVARTNPWATSFAALRIGAGVFLVPVAFVTQPELLFIGDLADTAVAAARLGVAVVAVSAMLIGQAGRPVPTLMRIAALPIAALCVLPVFEGAIGMVQWAAFGLGVVGLAWVLWPAATPATPAAPGASTSAEPGS